MSETAEFPQEITLEILSRLPSKALCRFKCVSKPWLTLISDPYFVEKHLTLHKKKERLILQKSPSLFSVDFQESSSDHYNSVILKELDFLSANWVEVLGSCNGLLLLLDQQKSLVLLNPSTRLFKKLPLPSLSPDFLSALVMYGFGYDSSTNDYKVVKITHYERQSSLEDVDWFISPTITICVYSVKWGYWRVSNYDRSLEMYRFSSGVFVNGSLHWLALSGSNDSSVIAAFDLAVEKFNILMPPSSIEYDKPFDYGEPIIYQISVVGGCLCLYDCSSPHGPSEVWVMKEYGKVESWTRFNIFHPNNTLLEDLFLLTDDCFLVLLSSNWIITKEYGCKWFVFNKKGEIVGEIDVNCISGWLVSYVESLVSPIPTKFIQRRDDGFGQATNAREMFASSLQLVEQILQQSGPEATIEEERTHLFEPTSSISNIGATCTSAADLLDPPSFLDSQFGDLDIHREDQHVVTKVMKSNKDTCWSVRIHQELA